MDHFETTEVQGLPAEFDEVGFVGFFGGSFPEWKWNLNLSYRQGALTLAGQWRYIDGMRAPGLPRLRSAQLRIFRSVRELRVRAGDISLA